MCGGAAHQASAHSKDKCCTAHLRTLCHSLRHNASCAHVPRVHPARLVGRLTASALLLKLMQSRRLPCRLSPRRHHALPHCGDVQVVSRVDDDRASLKLPHGLVRSLKRSNHASKHVCRNALDGASALVAAACQLRRSAHVQLHICGAACGSTQVSWVHEASAAPRARTRASKL